MADDAMARKHQREAPASERPGVHDPAVDEHTAKHLAYEVKTPKFSEFVSSQSEGAGMKAAERLAIVDQAWHPGSMAEARASSRPLSTGGCRSGGWWLSEWRMVAVGVAVGGCGGGGLCRSQGRMVGVAVADGGGGQEKSARALRASTSQASRASMACSASRAFLSLPADVALSS